MSQSPSPVTGAASILAARRTNGEQGPRLPEWCRPREVDTALAIQAAVTEQLGDRVGAWKCGMPAECNAVSRERLKVVALRTMADPPT